MKKWRRPDEVWVRGGKELEFGRKEMIRRSSSGGTVVRVGGQRVGVGHVIDTDMVKWELEKECLHRLIPTYPHYLFLILHTLSS